MSSSRDRILGRIREAVRTQSVRPPAPTSAPIFAPVTDPDQRFAQEFGSLKGELLESESKLRDFLAGFTKIATDGSDLVRSVAGEPTASVRDADLGITGCDCLIAQLGAIVVSPRSAGGRALSVLPPTHLVIARREQILLDLTAAVAYMRQRKDADPTGTISVIAGPSRTGDIEKIIVMGAHGPKRLLLYFA